MAVAILKWMYAFELKLTDGNTGKLERRLAIGPGLIEPYNEALHLNGNPARLGSSKWILGLANPT
ncbi:hypothetical protein [Agrobacterium cavarae]|uniref:hypothetical protein n=1 Tax=Agrobacterium cavarae TaxID=2528239 RepID=UPI003FD0A66E